MAFSLALLSFLPLLAAALPAQVQTEQTPTPRNAPPHLLSAFELRAGTIQDLVLPPGQRVPFEVRVVLDGQPCTLELFPDSIRSPDFQVFVTDAVGTHPVPAPEENTYRGTVVGMADSLVSAMLDQGQLEACIRAPGGGWAIQPLSDVMPGAPRDQHIVYRLADVVSPPVSCGVAHHGGVPQGSPVAGTGLQYCEIALDCDLANYQRNGSDVNATVNAALGLLYTVSAIYQTDVEIRYHVTSVIVRTTAVYTTGPNVGCSGFGLLQELTNRWIGNHGNVQRDVAHLLSGSGAWSGTIGCANVGTVCSQTSGYGVSRVVSTNAAQNVALVAHELGHNWGANHCDAAPPCNIMCSGLGGCSGVGNSFSAGERATIVAFKATRTCLTTPAPIAPNPNLFYRLTTHFQGPNLSLDVINDGNNNRMIMAATGPYSGQAWKFTPTPEHPGTWRISCMWRGDSQVMDIINGGADDNQPILVPVGPTSGQFWFVTEIPGAPGHVALHTAFRGANLALEGAGGSTGNRPVLASFGPYTGQMWLLTPLVSANPAATTPFGAACRGRDGVPQLQATNGTAPWVGENMTGEITNVAAGTLPALVIGPRLATPIDLGVVNSPGCFLRVDLLSLLTLSPSGGRGPFILGLPRDVSLVGVVLPVQGLVIDPLRGTSDPLVAVTNGLDLQFGLR